jgi:hypothetical protein
LQETRAARASLANADDRLEMRGIQRGVPSGLYTASTLLVLGGAFEYIPRKPEETVLYGAIAEQLETFLFPEQF